MLQSLRPASRIAEKLHHPRHVPGMTQVSSVDQHAVETRRSPTAGLGLSIGRYQGFGVNDLSLCGCEDIVS
jgi:hypothetical protein